MNALFALISDYVREQVVQITLVVTGVAAMAKAGHWMYRGLRKLFELADFVQHELNENSGRSLRDYAVRTDARIEYLFKQQGIDMPDDLKTPPPPDGSSKENR